MEFDSLRIGYSSPATSGQQAQSSDTGKGSPVTDGNSGYDTAVAGATREATRVDESNRSNEGTSQAQNHQIYERDLNEADIQKAVNEANKKLRGSYREFAYNIHRKTNTVMVKIINSETKETIREIPPERTLDAIAKMWELAGIIVDERK